MNFTPQCRKLLLCHLPEGILLHLAKHLDLNGAANLRRLAEHLGFQPLDVQWVVENARNFPHGSPTLGFFEINKTKIFIVNVISGLQKINNKSCMQLILQYLVTKGYVTLSSELDNPTDLAKPLSDRASFSPPSEDSLKKDRPLNDNLPASNIACSLVKPTSNIETDIDIETRSSEISLSTKNHPAGQGDDILKHPGLQTDAVKDSIPESSSMTAGAVEKELENPRSDHGYQTSDASSVESDDEESDIWKRVELIGQYSDDDNSSIAHNNADVECGQNLTMGAYDFNKYSTIGAMQTQSTIYPNAQHTGLSYLSNSSQALSLDFPQNVQYVHPPPINYIPVQNVVLPPCQTVGNVVPNPIMPPLSTIRYAQDPPDPTGQSDRQRISQQARMLVPRGGSGIKSLTQLNISSEVRSADDKLNPAVLIKFDVSPAVQSSCNKDNFKQSNILLQPAIMNGSSNIILVGRQAQGIVDKRSGSNLPGFAGHGPQHLDYISEKPEREISRQNITQERPSQSARNKSLVFYNSDSITNPLLSGIYPRNVHPGHVANTTRIINANSLVDACLSDVNQSQTVIVSSNSSSNIIKDTKDSLSSSSSVQRRDGSSTRSSAKEEFPTTQNHESKSIQRQMSRSDTSVQNQHIDRGKSREIGPCGGVVKHLEVKAKRLTHPLTEKEKQELMSNNADSSLRRRINDNGKHPLLQASANCVLDSHAFERDERRVRVFVTYSVDSKHHMKYVMNVCRTLKRNQFSVSLDLREASLVTQQNFTDWIDERMKAVDYILVLISPQYSIDVERRPDNAKTSNTDQTPALNTLYIHRQMQLEYESNGYKNKRFIPLLMTQSGATEDHIPSWLRNTTSYSWPKDYFSLFFFMTHPERSLLDYINDTVRGDSLSTNASGYGYKPEIGSSVAYDLSVRRPEELTDERQRSLCDNDDVRKCIKEESKSFRLDEKAKSNFSCIPLSVKH